MKKKRKYVRKLKASEVFDEAIKECPGINPMLTGSPEEETKFIKWVYITLPTGKVYKLAADKIVENFHIFNPLITNVHTGRVDDAFMLKDWLHAHMTWHDIKDNVIQVNRQLTLDPEELFRLAVITTDAKEAGVIEE